MLNTRALFTCGSLMVSALDPGTNGPGWRPGRGHCVVFLGKTLDSHSAQALSTQVYKWLPANLKCTYP